MKTKMKPNAAIKRVAVYLRVSVETEHKLAAKERAGRSTGNAEFSSLDAQLDAARAYIKSQPGWQFVQKYVDDGRTGANLKRTAVQAMFADIEAGKIDAVVVYKIDRLSRSLRDFVAVMAQFDAKGITFASVTQNFQTDTPVGRLTLNILASFAEFEREMIVERTRDKIARTRARGLWSGGQPPLGYNLVKGALEVNEREAKIVRDIFARYLDTRSVRDVAQSLNSEKRKIKQRGKHARAWTPDMVSRVLQNPTVTGVIPHNDQTYEGKHKAIVKRATFEHARAALAANTVEGKRKGRNPKYVLQGIIRCTCTARNGRVCDSAMAPGSSGNTKGQYRYYRCVGREKGRDGCPAEALPAQAIEAFVVDRLREIAAAGSVAGQTAAHARELVQKHRPAIAAEVTRLTAAVAKTSEASARLAERMASAKPSARDAMVIRADRLYLDLAKHETDLAEARKRLAAIDAADAEAKWLAEQLGSFDSVWEVLTPEFRGRLLRGLVRTVQVDEPNHKIAIVFAPLDETRRAVLGENAGNADRYASTITGELHRDRVGKGIAFQQKARAPKRPPVERPAKIARLLALAHHLDRAIASGKCPDLATMAARLKMTRPRITQVVSLTFLAPDIQAEVLALRAIDGREPVRERALRPIATIPHWDRQRTQWERLKAAREAASERPTRNPHQRGKAA
jgi:site-specific DNA recombinase